MSEMPFERIAGHYDLLNDVLSWGMHRRWKAKLSTSVLSLRPPACPGILDVATGTGDVVLGFLQQPECRESEIIGLDPSQAMLNIAAGRTLAARWVNAPSEALPVASASVGVVTCAFGVRNFQDRPAFVINTVEQVMHGCSIAPLFT